MAVQISRAICLALAAVPLIAPAIAASDDIVFDIPPQSLDTALEFYSVAAGREVVYDGRLATGRQSRSLKGAYSAEAALRVLLEGTGISPRFMSTDAFVLVPDVAISKPSPSEDMVPPVAISRYYGDIQAALKRALCGNDLTQPGNYRVVVSFWIGTGGTVSRVELLGSSDDRYRDGVIIQTIRALSINRPPPPGFAQPVTLMVVPRLQGAAIDCPAAALQPVKMQP
ncbi:TonB family protein [Blastochloris viridis]|nr:TonB family protein [Blastochloris viridis]